jgi:hypothetical protein
VHVIWEEKASETIFYICSIYSGVRVIKFLEVFGRLLVVRYLLPAVASSHLLPSAAYNMFMDLSEQEQQILYEILHNRIAQTD